VRVHPERDRGRLHDPGPAGGVPAPRRRSTS